MTKEQKEALDRLTSLYPILHVMTENLKLSNPGGEIRIAVVSKSPDGTGQVGPSIEAEEFLADIKTLALMEEP